MQFVIRSLTTQQKKMGFFIDFLIKNGVGRWMRRFKKKGDENIDDKVSSYWRKL